MLDPSSIVGGGSPPPPPPPPPTGGVVLKPGQSGSAVTSLQTRLGVPTQYRTGYYGTITTGYVRDFQQTVGRPVTGVVDTATNAALTPRSKRTLTLGSRGSDVTALQAALRMPIAQRTGYFGTATRTAARAFQARHRLLVSGVAYSSLRAWLRL